MNDGCHYSVLTEPVFSVRARDDRRTQLSLPRIMAALAAEDLISFEALQTHQQQPWYCFLVQLAAIALSRAAEERLPDRPDRWRQMLLDLTDGDEAPWSLVVGDPARPAFLQPPVPEASLEQAGFQADVETPDELDMLVTSRNHDLKKCRIAHPRPEHWLFSLLTLQTMEGYSGSRNYGIVRMNGGYGSRPLVGMTPELGWSPRFCRDVRVLLGARQHLAEEYGYELRGQALLWILPWDGEASSAVHLQQCDPMFIEICRRIRLTRSQGTIQCWRATTKAGRVAAPDDLNGVTGDPWTPVDKSESKALSVGSAGFSYDRLQRIVLTGDFVRPPALDAEGLETRGGFLLATVLARGQGGTEGFHHRVVPVPARAIRLFSDPSEREKLGERAQARVEIAADVQKRVLTPALGQLLNAGEDGDIDWDEARPRLDAYNSTVDGIFFEHLWASLDLTEQQARRRWCDRVIELAERQLQSAVDSTPIPSIRRYRAISRAESVFYGSARNLRNQRFPQQKEEEHHEQSVSF